MAHEMTHFTYNEFHLGDQIITLHFLRALAKQNPTHDFVHYMPECHMGQMQEVVMDLPQIRIQPLEEKTPRALNCWKNANDFWVDHPKRWDWSGYHLAYATYLASIMRLPPPFHHVTDLLFDYPALEEVVLNRNLYKPDFLIVNSQPCSGQLLDYDSMQYMNDLVYDLSSRHDVIITQPIEGSGIECTQDGGMTLSDIGRYSVRAKHHIMVATGPMWPTLNTHNNHNRTGRHRIVLLGNNERLNMPAITQMANVKEVFDFANKEGWL